MSGTGSNTSKLPAKPKEGRPQHAVMPTLTSQGNGEMTKTQLKQAKWRAKRKAAAKAAGTATASGANAIPRK